jgi:hypothetical protein
MAGQLTIDTLRASSGVLATQNGMTGIAKAWCYYNASTQAVVGSFNVSSVTFIGTGAYQINFSTAMPNTTYVTVSNNEPNTSGALGSVTGSISQTTGYTYLQTFQATAGTRSNPTMVMCAVFSS